jgi:hypothetical protein
MHLTMNNTFVKVEALKITMDNQQEINSVNEQAVADGASVELSLHDDFRGDTVVVHLTARPIKNIAHKKRGCATRNTCTVL